MCVCIYMYVCTHAHTHIHCFSGSLERKTCTKKNEKFLYKTLLLENAPKLLLFHFSVNHILCVYKHST